MNVRLTRHARAKLILLAQHGFAVSEADVVAVLRSPDRVEQDRCPQIAQGRHGAQHVPRIVFRRGGVKRRPKTPGYRGHYGLSRPEGTL